MALKVKNDDKDESPEDEDTKFKSYITGQFKKLFKNANVKASDMDHKRSGFSKFKSNSRENPKKLDKAVILQLVQSVNIRFLK